VSDLRKSPPQPYQARHIGTVRLRTDDGSLAVALADGRQAFIAAREIRSNIFGPFMPGQKIVCSIMKREGEKTLLGYDVSRF
jgi:hypothetical protein